MPLCGKSKDIVWLLEAGYEVVGIELSDVAAKAFFKENGLDMTPEQVGEHTKYHGHGLDYLVGDFFTANATLIGTFQAIYDRAAYIALPPERRSQYAAALNTLSTPACKTCLITVNYDPSEIKPPPYHIPTEEVDEVFAPWSNIEHIETAPTDIKGKPGFEQVYLN